MTWEAYNEVINAPHRAKLSHELIAAAASYEAMKAWDQHKERHGEAVDHAKRNEIMAAAAGFFIDRMIETKGLDFIDRHRTRQHAEGLYGGYYGQGPYNNQPYGYAAPGYMVAPAVPLGYVAYENQSYENEHHHHHHHHHHDHHLLHHHRH